jgi:beta-lactam-binding protein with PASTA domain
VVKCKVPRVVGLTLKKAKAKIKKAHCRVGKVTKRVNARRAGRVLKQSPKAGTRKPKGFKVKLVVGRR